jgi:hypothetical protein
MSRFGIEINVQTGEVRQVDVPEIELPEIELPEVIANDTNEL